MGEKHIAMPKITEVHLIYITPEKFLENCNDVELREVDHLIQSRRFRVRIDQTEDSPRPANYPDIDVVIDPIQLTCH